jgi:hypothetical protein
LKSIFKVNIFSTMQAHDGNRTRVAHSDVATVEWCPCGVVHLHLGAITARFTRHAFETLHATLTSALLQMPRPTAEAMLPTRVRGQA